MHEVIIEIDHDYPCKGHIMISAGEIFHDIPDHPKGWAIRYQHVFNRPKLCSPDGLERYVRDGVHHALTKLSHAVVDWERNGRPTE